MLTRVFSALCPAALLAALASNAFSQSLGYWGPLKTSALGTWQAGLVAIHMVHMPGGQLLLWDDAMGTWPNESTQAYVWNSTTG